MVRRGLPIPYSSLLAVVVDAPPNPGVNVNSTYLDGANSDGVTLDSTITLLFAALRLGYHVVGKSDAIIQATGASVDNRVLPHR